MDVKIYYPQGQMTVRLDAIVANERLGRGFVHPIAKVRKMFKLMVQWCDDEDINIIQVYLSEHSPRYTKEFLEQRKKEGLKLVLQRLRSY